MAVTRLAVCLFLTMRVLHGLQVQNIRWPESIHRHSGQISQIRRRQTRPFFPASSPRCSASSDDHDSSLMYQERYNTLQAASRLSLAPMMEYTDKYFRHLVRLISKNTLVYTEMVAGNSLSYEYASVRQDYRELHPTCSDKELRDGYDDYFLRRHTSQSPIEGPSVLQLGGSDPTQMHTAAQVVQDMRSRGVCNYTALNLNCGCPSPKVAGKGQFGAALMEDPLLVRDLTQALHDGSEGQYPISVKCRIGTDADQSFTKLTYQDIDEEKEYSQLCRFVEQVASNGIVTDFSVHARIAVLRKKFSPQDNRQIPPVKYHLVHRLVNDYPSLTFSLNGGLDSIADAQGQFQQCPGLKGVMIGRAWAADPWSFSMADTLLYDDTSESGEGRNRWQILQEYGKFADEQEASGDATKVRRFLTKAVTQLFAGEPGGKKYRIELDRIAGVPKALHKQGKTMEGLPPLSELILNAASETLSEDVLLRTPQESYDLRLAEEEYRLAKLNGHRSVAVAEWQKDRKEQQEPSLYEKTLQLGTPDTLV